MILGFAGVILLGALVLMLPIATVQRVWTPFHEALFTSTSAVCVTGLVVQDTGSYWSAFGQTVILLLIQIGGLGVITGAVTFLMLAGRNITLKERSAMQDAISAPAVGGIVRLTRFILKGTFLVELLGALALLPVFCRDYGLRGVWMSVFHSVSAFCNAGFDILGRTDSFYPSLTVYAADPLVNIVIMLLIIVGGIGFLTWDDVCTHGLHLRQYRMQSKVILSATALLIALPAVLFFLTDFADLPIGERILASLFQSVTPRTAGYNTVDLTKMSDTSQAVTILLMLTGGAPGSTAGGMKVTTLAVLIANAVAALSKTADRLVLRVSAYTDTESAVPVCAMEPLENICYALSVLNDQVFAGKLSLLLTASGQARKSGGRFSGIDETALNALLQKGTAYYSDRYACAYVEAGDTTAWYLDGRALDARRQLLNCFGVNSLCLSTLNGTLNPTEN